MFSKNILRNIKTNPSFLISGVVVLIVLILFSKKLLAKNNETSIQNKEKIKQEIIIDNVGSSNNTASKSGYLSQKVVLAKTTPYITPTISNIKNAPKENNSKEEPTPTITPTKIIFQPTNTPTITKVPTTTPTVAVKLTPTTTPTTTPVTQILSTGAQSERKETMLFPQGNFTPDGKGKVEIVANKNSNGYWDFAVTGSFEKLIPNRNYQFWIYNINGSSNNEAKFTTDSNGNGSINTTINHAQSRDPVSSIRVYEIPPGGEVPNDPTACFDISTTSIPCIKASIYF
jgi:hypothetical protein